MFSEKIIKNSLTAEQVKEQIILGNVNIGTNSKSKPISKIFGDNIFTLFNLINIILFVLLLIAGSYKNTMFMMVVVFNTLIGIVQEIRYKIAVDKLSLVATSKVDVVRDGEIVNISTDEIVIGDVIKLTAGAQIPADCVVIDGFCFVNESLLTGESDLIEKQEDAKLLSGSFVSSGEVFAKVNSVGKDNFAVKIQQEASYSKKISSEIMSALNKILLVCSIAIIPVGLLMFFNKLYVNKLEFADTVSSTVGALIGMIPEGLILLTSSVLAVSVIRLARKKVLVQQLYCIETLARVNMLCLDKTGTITTGNMEVVDVDCIGNDEGYIKKVLKSITANSVDNNPTMRAIDKYSDVECFNSINMVPFSSEKKWSGGNFSNGKSYVLGAFEAIYDNSKLELKSKIDQIDDVYRVVVLAESNNQISNNELPIDLTPIALVIIKDEIRSNANETIEYFNKQGVALKVISGDNHKTVEQIAKSVGMVDADKSIDATTLKTDQDICNATKEYTVFGRVTPEQKKKIIIELKKSGNTVAMTGDGVNDVLALKEADCSVSIASGSDAAKNISQIVLVNDDFGSMPEVVEEGRRTINNIQRSGSLFLVKTIYSAVLAIAYIFFTSQYPFEPIHLTLISAFTIGLPSFVLALEPNHNLVKGKFIRNILLNALPSALVVIANGLALGFISHHYTGDQISTMASIITAVVGVMLVIRLSLPLNRLRALLIAVVIIGFTTCVVFLNDFIGLALLPTYGIVTLTIMTIISIVAFNILFTLFHRIAERK